MAAAVNTAAAKAHDKQVGETKASRSCLTVDDVLCTDFFDHVKSTGDSYSTLSCTASGNVLLFPITSIETLLHSKDNAASLSWQTHVDRGVGRSNACHGAAAGPGLANHLTLPPATLCGRGSERIDISPRSSGGCELSADDIGPAAHPGVSSRAAAVPWDGEGPRFDGFVWDCRDGYGRSKWHWHAARRHQDRQRAHGHCRCLTWAACRGVN